MIITLPGPPRELRPMWADEVLPRLHARGVGGDSEVRTFRLHGIGESMVAERLGEALLRAANPIVATYARHEAVDVRISARPEAGRPAAALADEAEATVLSAVGDHVWAHGDTTWASALGAALAEHDWTLATTEQGTDGALVTLLRALPAVVLAERRPHPGDDGTEGGPIDDGADERAVESEARRVRRESGADVGLAIRVRPGGDDTTLHVGVATPSATRVERRVTFLRGNQGSDRAAIAGAAVLLEVLRDPRSG